MKIRPLDIALLLGLALVSSVLRAATLPPIFVSAGKTYLVDTAVNIERVSMGSPAIAEAVPVTPRTLMVNGKTPGETSLIVWLNDGTRSEYDVTVRLGDTRLNAVREQLDHEFGSGLKIAADSGSVYLSGTVKDLYASQRAVSIAETLGKVVNLLNVETPARETQILLKVRFANVDRSKALELGIAFVGTPQGFPFSVRSGVAGTASVSSISPAAVTITDALNLLFWNPQLNVGATLRDLASKNVLQILAEPNVLAMNGHEASFVAGGEFPFPTVSGSGGSAQVSVSFRQFGVQIRFLPTITPRGTIRLHVAPEVSSLDYANALTVAGNTVPALSTRRVSTDVELEDGQTFAIAGLLDRRTTESLTRIPGLADIPILGKLFTSRVTNTSNSELLIIITPELVAPVPVGKPVPDLERPLKFMEGKGVMNTPPQTPGPDVTGPPSVKPERSELSVQEMQQLKLDLSRTTSGAGGGAGSDMVPAAGGGMGAGAAAAQSIAAPALPAPATAVFNGQTKGVPQQP